MDAPDAPEPPPSKGKGGFKGKRKKGLAYQRKKGGKNQKSSPPPPRDPDEESTLVKQVPEVASAPVAVPDTKPSAVASKSYKYMSKAELVSILTECEQELASARVDIVQRDKTINSLSKKNNKLVEVSQAARTSAREAKQYVKNVEKNASQSEKKLRDEVAAAEEWRVNQLQESNARWKNEVERVKEVEQVSFESIFLFLHSICNSLTFNIYL